MYDDIWINVEICVKTSLVYLCRQTFTRFDRPSHQRPWNLVGCSLVTSSNTQHTIKQFISAFVMKLPLWISY